MQSTFVDTTFGGGYALYKVSCNLSEIGVSMLLNGKRLINLIATDLQSLIGRSEDKTIDFKEDAYPPIAEDKLKDKPEREKKDLRDKWKNELCKDVSAFANASGGWIICGIKDKEGEAIDLCGLGEIDVDGEILRLRQCIDNGVEPKIILDMKAVDLGEYNKGKAIVIEIPQSFAAPHRVKATGKFHIRRTRGVDEMDMHELRTAFNLSETYIERIRTFRKHRANTLASEMSDEIPVTLTSGYRVMVHIMPINVADPSTIISFNSLEFIKEALFKESISTFFTNSMTFNFDGLLLPRYQHDEISDEYIQIYRNGIFEHVRVMKESSSNHDPFPVISPIFIEQQCMFATQVGFNILQGFNIDPPYIIMLSLIGIRGKGFTRTGPMDDTRRNPFSQNTLLIPEIMVENIKNPIDKLLRSTFNILWNSGGYWFSWSYNNNGDYILPFSYRNTVYGSIKS